MTAPYAFLGSYQDLNSCQFAMREIFAVRMNAPGQRDPQFDKAIDMLVKNNREFVCVPNKKN